jgi:hypothetical protein
LTILFEDPIPLFNTTLSVEASVTPVWNSLNCRYPSSWNVEQAVSNINRTVHPLDASDLGSVWLPWDISYAGAADDAKIKFSWMCPVKPTLFGKNGDLGFHLSFVPVETPTRAGTEDGPPMLSVVLTKEAREMLDESRKRLRIDFQATTGAIANGLPAGTEFQLIDLAEIPMPERVTGTLVGDTWGGTDGLLSFLDHDVISDHIRAVIPTRTWRSVGDVSRILEQAYGHELQMVDERDLLRGEHGNEVRPLTVRVAFRQPARDRQYRDTLLTSCNRFLNRYLSLSNVGDVVLAEAYDGEGRDEN